MKPAPRGTHKLTVNGKTRLVSEWARLYGLSYRTVLLRIRRGLPALECIKQTRAISLRRTFHCEVCGLAFRAIHSNAKVCGKACQSAKYAITTKRGDRRLVPPVLLELNGEKLSIAAWAERSGLLRVTVANRLRAGWPPSEAVSVPPYGRRKVAA